MRLLHPSPGEIADRQTILQIKMRVCAVKKIPLQHFVGEHEALQNYLEKEWFPEMLVKFGPDGGKKFDDLLAELERVNQGLWNLEDEIRSIRAMSDDHRREHESRVIEIAFAIADMNDERMVLVAEINQLFDVKTREKVYAA